MLQQLCPNNQTLMIVVWLCFKCLRPQEKWDPFLAHEAKQNGMSHCCLVSLCSLAIWICFDSQAILVGYCVARQLQHSLELQIHTIRTLWGGWVMALLFWGHAGMVVNQRKSSALLLATQYFTFLSHGRPCASLAPKMPSKFWGWLGNCCFCP